MIMINVWLHRDLVFFFFYKTIEFLFHLYVDFVIWMRNEEWSTNDNGDDLLRFLRLWLENIINLNVLFVYVVFLRRSILSYSIVYVLSINIKGVIILTLLNSQTHIKNEVYEWELKDILRRDLVQGSPYLAKP